MLKRSLVGRLPRIQPRPSSRRAPLLQARNPFRRTTDEPQRRRRAAALSSLSPSTVCGRNGDATSFPAVGDTIYALSTAHGRGGIAVIRISGPSCLQIYKALCPGKAPPKPRRATIRTLHDPAGPGRGNEEPTVLDSEALLLYFAAPKTVTGEDVLELHVHGGPATVKAVLSALPRCAPAAARVRHAEPGEFTKRAFIHGRLDLAQVESLGDTLDAETEQQRRAAVRGNSGALGRAYDGWREQLLQARGELEALIDFSEDQHFDEPQSELLGSVAGQVAGILRAIELAELGGQRSELLRKGIRIALVGPPNAGKSSLMNLIVGREASIVSGEAGTTRDIVEASLDIGGYLCSFADTAGFRGQRHEDGPGGGARISAVEEEGIRRARRRAQESDLVIVLASVEQRAPGGAAAAAAAAAAAGSFIRFDPETLSLAAEAQAALVVVNKRDAVAVADGDDDAALATLVHRFRRHVDERHPALRGAPPVCISCTEDAGGAQDVVRALVARFAAMTDMPADARDLLGVTERQGQLLGRCRRHLEAFMAEARREDRADADVVLAAEYLRYAADCLARITGRGEAGDVEEVLGVVFAR
ncbi:hypothetical protein UVI_02011510 [Ustilaginoidea virens]|uniref:Uncharacterized protein n=1 Tax=Ustilaginoidea virens TaxID=1159556 RepID=A0A1B5L348_USTVR|nr:hypothetical protein UVI_02011510 [Ustilaginoidea virens]